MCINEHYTLFMDVQIYDAPQLINANIFLTKRQTLSYEESRPFLVASTNVSDPDAPLLCPLPEARMDLLLNDTFNEFRPGAYCRCASWLPGAASCTWWAHSSACPSAEAAPSTAVHYLPDLKL